MFGWINDCTEKLVISKFGIEKWHEIKEKAGCTVRDGGFIRHKTYTDESTVQLVGAASVVLGIPVDGILEAFGQYFMEFVRAEGFQNLLSCQGGTLRTWLSNINALHDHLESSFPRGMIKPVFWCEDDEAIEGTILLHYYSKRGNLLAPIVPGLVKEVARFHFDVSINMEMLDKQGVGGAKFTTFRVSAADPLDSWKITLREKEATSFDESLPVFRGSGSCPFTGVKIGQPKDNDGMMDESTVLSTSPETVATERNIDDSTSSHQSSGSSATVQTNSVHVEMIDALEEEQTRHRSQKEVSFPMPDMATPNISLSGNKMRQIFPYHIVVDYDFTILQVGNSFAKLLRIEEADLIGASLRDTLKITKPLHGEWEWHALRKLEDQTFFMDPVRLKPILTHVKLKGNILKISSDPFQVMFVLSPDAKNVFELQEMDLTMSDLPLHSFQRDAVFLGEHIVSEVKSSHKLDKISKRLCHEKSLSNALLYSLLPQHVADELRAGKSVDPELHENVTMFFSDIVGFTNICGDIFPYEVIDMLNRLYCIMDFLAKKFRLYKIETVGDAYLCCSGLPSEDPNHAENVANFAIATQHCCQQVLSPLDGTPIQLRIGIHSGQCMSGVVGMSTPRYCVFGDMVNTTSRHESTGVAGQIQVSCITFGKLYHDRRTQEEHYLFSPRGLVEMKGKGHMFTYWLDGATDENPLVNDGALAAIDNEVREALTKRNFKNKKYFRRYGRRGSETALMDSSVSTYTPSEFSEGTEYTDDNSP